MNLFRSLMNMNLVASIPVKPHLRKFVHYLENLAPDAPLNLSRSGVVGYTLNLLLTNKTNLIHSDTLAGDKLQEKFQDQLRFKVSVRMQTFNCFYLTRRSISIFNTFLHNLLHETLLYRIRMGVAAGQDEKEIIYDFMRELDIEEDVTFDAVKKANYRLRNAKKIPTIHQQSRPEAVNA